MAGHHRLFHFKPIQQLHGHARILRSDQVGSFERGAHSRRKIIQIPDRRRDDIQFWHNFSPIKANCESFAGALRRADTPNRRKRHTVYRIFRSALRLLEVNVHTSITAVIILLRRDGQHFRNPFKFANGQFFRARIQFFRQRNQRIDAPFARRSIADSRRTNASQSNAKQNWERIFAANACDHARSDATNDHNHRHPNAKARIVAR